jgi:Na+/H+ antiporter NhaC
LAGAVFGDHCSPISDTTVLSAVACRCPLINHVKSQFPYALLVGSMGVLVGDLPTGKLE